MRRVGGGGGCGGASCTGGGGVGVLASISVKDMGCVRRRWIGRDHAHHGKLNEESFVFRTKGDGWNEA